MTAAVLSDALAKHEGRAQELRDKLVELNEREQDAVAADLRKTPSRNPLGQITSATSKLRRSREDAQKELAGLESTVLPRLREETHTAARAEAEELLVKQRAKLRRLDQAAAAGWSEVVTAFGTVGAVYDNVADEYAAGLAAVKAETLTGLASFGDMTEAFQTEFAAIEPAVPASFTAALDRLRRDAAVPLHHGPQVVYQDNGRDAQGFGSRIVYRKGV